MINSFSKSMALMCFFSLGATPALDARVTPKMRGKAGKELQVNRYQLTGNEETVYVKKWKVGLIGGLVLTLGIASACISYFDSSADTADRYFFGICAPLEIGAGLYCLKYLLNNKPYLIINEEGIRSQDHGFLPWVQVTSLEMTSINGQGVITIRMITGKKATISDGFLQDSMIDIVAKISRYRNVVYSPKTGTFFLEEYPEPEKKQA